MDAAPTSLRGGVGGFVAGGASVARGLGRVLSEAPLRRLALVPLALTALVYVLAVVALVWWGPDILGWVWDRPAEGWLKWLWYVVLPLAIALVVVVIVLLFGTVAEAIGGPFYDKMAMRVLEGAGIPAKEPGLIAGTVPDLIRSLAFVAAAVACGLLAFIPVVGIAFAVVGTAIAWAGLAASALNPALLVTGHGFFARLGYFLRSFAALAGMGATIGVMLLVPLAGLLVLPGAVVGAADLYARSRRGYGA